MDCWLTTDTHLGHGMLVEQGFRPKGFEELIFSNLKKAVKPNDLLIHFGDVSFSDHIYWNERLTDFGLKRWLIRGNHDDRSISWYIDRGWDFVGDTASITLFGAKILMSHAPQPDTGYDINIHGHLHNSDHRTNEPEISSILTSKHVLLAVELNSYLPWNLRKVVETFKNVKK